MSTVQSMGHSDNMAIEAQRNSRGHLKRQEIAYVLRRWRIRQSNDGILSALAKKHGVSHATIANVIWRETGLRPAHHQKPAAK